MDMDAGSEKVGPPSKLPCLLKDDHPEPVPGSVPEGDTKSDGVSVDKIEATQSEGGRILEELVPLPRMVHTIDNNLGYLRNQNEALQLDVRSLLQDHALIWHLHSNIEILQDENRELRHTLVNESRKTRDMIRKQAIESDTYLKELLRIESKSLQHSNQQSAKEIKDLLKKELGNVKNLLNNTKDICKSTIKEIKSGFSSIKQHVEEVAKPGLEGLKGDMNSMNSLMAGIAGSLGVIEPIHQRHISTRELPSALERAETVDIVDTARLRRRRPPFHRRPQILPSGMTPGTGANATIVNINSMTPPEMEIPTIKVELPSMSQTFLGPFPAVQLLDGAITSKSFSLPHNDPPKTTKTSHSVYPQEAQSTPSFLVPTYPEVTLASTAPSRKRKCMESLPTDSDLGLKKVKMDPGTPPL
ncbi:MAG: hypothetical protein M1834_008530 [Cirrosporium novae-zelandiae]|nr:MAG: hypothetical protein M1834_008530 [Cirrosporium novae-zelandiae]